MDTVKKILRLLGRVGIMMLQLIMALVITFIISMFVPEIGNFQQTYPVVFIIILGLAFTIGIFLVGWLVIRLGWLTQEPKYLARLAGTLVGVFVPLIVALFVYHPLEANPLFNIAMLTGVLGFYVPSMAVNSSNPYKG